METQHFTANEELALSIAACMRRRALGERSKRAVEELAQKGVYSGKPVNGYEKIPKLETHQVNELKRGKIVRIWHLAGTEGWPLRKLLRECDAIGLTSVSGGKIGLNSLHLMLTNPFYAGKVRTGAGLVGGKHEALVSWTLFETVQRNLRRRKC